MNCSPLAQLRTLKGGVRWSRCWTNMVLNISMIDRKNFLFHFWISSLPGGLACKSLLARINAQSTQFIHLFCAIYTPVLLHTYKQSDVGLYILPRMGVYLREWMDVYLRESSLPGKPPAIVEIQKSKKVFSGSSETHLPSYKFNFLTTVLPL